MVQDETIKAVLREFAVQQGFVRVGFAKAERLAMEQKNLGEWLDKGYHGTMNWMKNHEAIRCDPEQFFPGTKTVIALAYPYRRKASEEESQRLLGVAQYARGRDYHRVLKKKMKSLVDWIEAQGYKARMSVDSAPVMERAWAQRAGVGFIGKNTCLIIPGVGSHVFLATLHTTMLIEPDKAMEGRCGSCTLCLKECPTQAFAEPYELNAQRCISYLTIEHKGEIDPELEGALGDQIFGCDICQDVCPYNKTEHSYNVPGSEAFAPKHISEHMANLEEMDEEAFKRHFEGSPIRRAGLASMQRNVILRKKVSTSKE